MIDKISRTEKELYLIADIVAQNRGDRKVVLWGNSNELREVLRKYFKIEVAFVVTILDHIVNGTSIRHLKTMKGKSDQYYLVSWGRAYEEYYDNLLHEYGFAEIEDYVYRMIKPIVVENWNLADGNYDDRYGNHIEGESGILGKVIFRGYNNRIKMAPNVEDMQKLEIQMCANSFIEVGEGTRFQNFVKFQMNGYNGSSSIYIGRWCRFDETFFRTYNHWHNSYVVINDNSTFEENVAIHANSGKGVVIGQDCMFSRDIQLQAGDGHSIFDVHTRQNVNTVYQKEDKLKNNLLIGEHVWVCARAFLLNGTCIGNGSIVGANSTVKGDFPNNCVIAGNPGKEVKRDVAWSREGCSGDLDSSVRKEYAVETKDTKPSLYGSNVLVIGGTRFTGLQLVKELLARGNQVTIATRGNTKDPFGERIKRIKLDLDKPDTVKLALEGKYYDVVFHNLAYCSNYVKEILDCVHCKKYIQLSSVMVYAPLKENLREDSFDAFSYPMEWSFTNGDYAKGKRDAEAAVVQGYPDIDYVMVRLPYVSKIGRLYYYCNHIVNQIPMKILDVNRGFTFIRDAEAGKFLPWIAAQDYIGTINLASTGMITLKELINYIEKKTGEKAIYDSKEGDESPFNEMSYYLNMSRAESLGYVTSSLDEWFWTVIDEYIAKAVREKELLGTSKFLLSDKTKEQPVQKSGKLHFFSKFRKSMEKKETIDEVSVDLCTGCGACKNICPRNAVKLLPDHEGFLKPVIDREKCVSCGLCRKVCPVFSEITYLKPNVSCYALMAQDEIRQVSSSGGAFSLLAERVLELKGAVCGAAWVDYYRAKQIIIQDAEQISELRGSKYVQSDTDFSFRYVEEILKKKRLVMYVGTPCQINGLLHYLQKDYANLITVDLLCRGNASNELFVRFLKEDYKDKIIKAISFKDKKPLGWGATTSYHFDDGNVEKTNTYNSIWMCAYLADFMDRRSCYHCKFNSQNRVGDISIGDFWGIEKYNQDLNDRKGTSIVITSTEKGNKLVEEIRGKCKVLEEVPIQQGIPYNSALCHHVKLSPKREMFFEALDKMPFPAAVDRAIYGKKYDVGIVGWWYNLNYGGTLTYYALNQAVKRLGYSTLMIRRSSSGPSMPNDNTVPMRFAKKHYQISRLYTGRDMHWLNYSCHAFISGSDQLWNPYLEQYSGFEYYLSFVNDHNLKLSYASSFGGVEEVPGRYVEKYKAYLKRFDSITVREDYAVDICNRDWGLNAVQICDPIFLCDKDQYEELAVDSKMQMPEKFVLNFLLDPNNEKVKACQFVKDTLGMLKSVNFTDLQDVARRVEQFGGDKAYGNAEIEDFIKAYKEADFVITDSFHGTCLAIIFNKPFITIMNKQRGEKRFISLMNWVGLSNRLVDSADEIYHRMDLLEEVDYSLVKVVIKSAQEQGFSWLKEKLSEIRQG